MDKYYRVKKDNFLWKEGAILRLDLKLGNSGGYIPIEDIWNKVPSEFTCSEYIGRRFIEDSENADWFERVYPDTVAGKLFRTKDQMVSMYKETFA